MNYLKSCTVLEQSLQMFKYCDVSRFNGKSLDFEVF